MGGGGLGIRPPAQAKADRRQQRDGTLRRRPRRRRSAPTRTQNGDGRRAGESERRREPRRTHTEERRTTRATAPTPGRATRPHTPKAENQTTAPEQARRKKRIPCVDLRDKKMNKRRQTNLSLSVVFGVFFFVSIFIESK